MRLDARLEIRLSSEDRRQLELLASARGWPVAFLVREFLREGLERELEDGRRGRRG